MSEQQWHGLTFDQWLKLWDAEGWRDKVKETLVEIVSSPGAAAADRLLALQSISEAVGEGAFLPDPDYPEMLRDMLLEIQAGCKPPRKKVRKRYHARLLGARWMLSTAYQFMTSAADEPAKPVVDVDIPKYS